MLNIKVSNFKSFLEHLDNVGQTLDKGLEVGVMGVSPKKAMISEVLEHRWHAQGPAAPAHWDIGAEYVTWAFAARTARTMEEEILPEIVPDLLDAGIVEDEFWHEVGRIAVRTMKEIMRGVKTPPNAMSTIRRKGRNDPLIDTGEMKNSVSYRITDEPEKTTPYSDEVPLAF